MNVKLTNTEEWKDEKNEGTLGEVFIRCVALPRRFVYGVTDCRCNNVLWISENASLDSDRMQQD